MIQVREYALLSSDHTRKASLDVGIVSSSTLDWLLDLQQRWRGDSDLLVLQGRHSIKLGSYVGYLQSPGGECIEVLPKTQQEIPHHTAMERSRGLLRSMLLVSLHLKPREADEAALQHMRTPLHEWIIAEYLMELRKLVRRGLRFDYQQVEEENRFIRGQLNQTRQSRQTPGRAAWFHLRHDIYTPNRIENRLLRTALDYVLKITRSADSWRLANELAHQLSSIEPCSQPLLDLSHWQMSKFMQPYNAVKPWCELILEKLNPNFQKGLHNGIALLFPMEKLFEEYVGHCLKSALTSDSKLKKQAQSEYLLRHTPLSSSQEQRWFQLKPDLMILNRFSPAILDTKWKLLDGKAATSEGKYGISQSDLYQLFAYGHKYLNGKGHMMLIYPKHCGFEQPLPSFSYDERLHLWTVPFDCDAKELVGGDWEYAFPALQSKRTLSRMMVN